MKYQVDGWNNFCRVFEIPESFPSDYCFGGGHKVNFQMVDWFNPVPGIHMAAVSKDVWRDEFGEDEFGEIETVEVDLNELEEKMRPFILDKNYAKPGRGYLILYDFGGSSVFRKEAV